MAEPIGLAASIVGLLAASAKIYSLASKFRDMYKDFPYLLSCAEAEVQAVSLAIHGIQQMLFEPYTGLESGFDGTILGEPFVPEPEGLALVLTFCVLTFSRLESILKEILAKTPSRKRGQRRLPYALAIISRSEELNIILERLQWVKSSLSLLLQVASR